MGRKNPLNHINERLFTNFVDKIFDFLITYSTNIFYLRNIDKKSIFLDYLRAVRRSENLGVPVLFGGYNLPPLVNIGLTDQPKSGGAPRDNRHVPT